MKQQILTESWQDSNNKMREYRNTCGAIREIAEYAPAMHNSTEHGKNGVNRL
jgi:hypothetical protein